MISPLQNDRYHVDEAFEEVWLKELEDLGHIAVMERLRQENLISQYWDKKMYVEASWLLHLYDALHWEYVGWLDGRYDWLRINPIFEKTSGLHFIYKYDPEGED